MSRRYFDKMTKNSGTLLVSATEIEPNIKADQIPANKAGRAIRAAAKDIAANVTAIQLTMGSYLVGNVHDVSVDTCTLKIGLKEINPKLPVQSAQRPAYKIARLLKGLGCKIDKLDYGVRDPALRLKGAQGSIVIETALPLAPKETDTDQKALLKEFRRAVLQRMEKLAA